MLGLNLIGQVANLAGTMIEGKTAVKKAEAETKMKIATGEIDWAEIIVMSSSITKGRLGSCPLREFTIESYFSDDTFILSNLSLLKICLT